MKQTELNIEILSCQILKGVPSASGIAKFNSHFYVIGDDAPYLFYIDSNFNIVSKTLIYSDEKLAGTTIPKLNKPDFEAMEMISETEILILGSGSKSPERDVCVYVDVKNKMKYTEYDLSLLFNHIRQMDSMVGYELNIEGLAIKNDILYLFNRGRNSVFSFPYQDFMTYCKTGTNFPIPETHLFCLASINGLEAGFSGATTFDNQPYFIFTASIEDTPNAYDDGEIVGSFIGLIAIINGKISNDFIIKQIPSPGFPLKVESVIVDKVISPTQTDLILVTDNDGKPSEIIRMRITLEHT